MMRKRLLLIAAAALGGSPMFAASTCESLAALELKNTAITMAKTVEAGPFALPQPQPGKGKQAQSYLKLPAFCRVAATITPVPDSEIRIEVWLPESGWNGNLQSVGNGAWAGSISYPALGTALKDGYAAASTDTG